MSKAHTTGNEPSLSLNHLSQEDKTLLETLAQALRLRQQAHSLTSLILFGERPQFVPMPMGLDHYARLPLNPDNKRDKLRFYHAFDFSPVTSPVADADLPPDVPRYIPAHSDNIPWYFPHLRLTVRPEWSLQHLGQLPDNRALPGPLHHSHLWLLTAPDSKRFYLTTRIPHSFDRLESHNPWQLPNFPALYHAIDAESPKVLPEHLHSFCLQAVADQVQQSLEGSTHA